MKFEKALTLMREGKKVRRKEWIAGSYQYIQDNVVYGMAAEYEDVNIITTPRIEWINILQDDWEEYIEEIPLLPCPFCGEQPSVYMSRRISPESSQTCYYVSCGECGDMKIKTDSYIDMDRAIECWNRR